MEPFEYDKYVTGKYFVGRSQDCRALGNLLAASENVALYDAPKTGKTSVIRQALTDMQTEGRRLIIVKLNLIRFRDVNRFITDFIASVLSALGGTPDSFGSYIERYLPGSCFGYSFEEFEAGRCPVVCNGPLTDEDIAACFRFPDEVAKTLGQQMCIILNEFSTLLDADGGERVMDIMEKVEAVRVKQPGEGACYIFCGSFLNAMKDIFEVKKRFYRCVELLPLSPFEEKDVTEHIVKGFLATGKSIERDLIHGPYTLFRGNMWYLNHLSAICSSKSIGYINSTILGDALSTIVSLHRPMFLRIISDLTDYQMSFVRAVLDGVVKLSAADVIERYGFNSSANVKRLKDALMKKEIVSFNQKDEPYIIDPLFEHWLRNYYFCGR